MTFEELLYSVGQQGLDIAIDSRKVRPGQIFVAIPGVNADGAEYIPAAVEAGAVTVVCREESSFSRAAAASGVAVVYHRDPRKALWRLAAARYHTEELCRAGLRIIGVTGTNGKTTTAYLLEHLFSRMGFKVGMLGTVNYRWPGHVELAPLTTPDSLSMHAMLATMAADGVNVVVMEVSSHALSQERVGGVPFEAAVFTNLTQDHLDFHQNMESYYRAKASLFLEMPQSEKCMAINSDDAWGLKLLQCCPGALSYGLAEQKREDGRHVAGQILEMSTSGMRLNMRWGRKQWVLSSPLVGAFNASNLMAVQTIGLSLGATVEDLRHLEDFYGVCGRLERVPNPQGLDVFVDYAHTPDALVNVLQALRGAGFTKIVTVFGCGGNRDKTKRPLMGKAVAQWSDVAVLTSDNPRHEEPEDIIADVLPGLQERSNLPYFVEADRRTATAKALELLRDPRYKGAAVLIAGKGHEDYQIIKGVKHPYSDQQTVRELLQCA